MAETAIEWATHVWNPVTGCSRVSPGCAHCYALTYAGRLKAMGQPKYQRVELARVRRRRRRRPAEPPGKGTGSLTAGQVQDYLIAAHKRRRAGAA